MGTPVKARLPKKDDDSLDQLLARTVGVHVLRDGKAFTPVWYDGSPLRSSPFASVEAAWNAVPRASSSWEELLPYLNVAWAANLYLQVYDQPPNDEKEWAAHLSSIHPKRYALQEYGVRMVAEGYGNGDTIEEAVARAFVYAYDRGYCLAHPRGELL